MLVALHERVERQLQAYEAAEGSAAARYRAVGAIARARPSGSCSAAGSWSGSASSRAGPDPAGSPMPIALRRPLALRVTSTQVAGGGGQRRSHRSGLGTPGTPDVLR
jgi:hypothetical protein